MNKKDLSISELKGLSKKLWDKNKEKWSPMSPEYAKLFVLWMVEEVGEVVAIIKKQGDEKIMNDKEIRRHFIEEMSDIIMYFMDVLNRFDISADEFSKIYQEKIEFNLKRDYKYSHKNLKAVK